MTETIDIETSDGVADGWVFRGGGPGVLFCMDAGGLRPRIAEMAERIADAGYTVLAPNAFYRGGRTPVVDASAFGDPDRRAAFFDVIRPLMGQLNKLNSTADGGAYLDALAELAPGPVGITGYCMGARLGLRIAAGYPDRVAAYGGFHGGGLVTDDAESPHLDAGQVRAEVYFGHADEDPNMTLDQIKTLADALEAGGVTQRSELYAGAHHGYTMSDTAVYDETATERHFDALLALFGRNLRASPGS